MLCSRRRPPTRCAPGSRTGSRALRGARGHHLPGLLRAAAARRGARGRARPVRHAGQRRRPAGDAARADRRAAAAPPRPARQPERHARRDRPAHRPAQGRAGDRRTTTRRGRRAPDEEPPREREFAALYAAHERLLAEAGTLDVGDLVLHASACCASAARARGSPSATGTCWSTSSRTRASPRACCCGCSSPTSATSPRRPTTTRRSTASAAPRPRTCATSAPSGRRRPWCGSSARTAPASASSRRPRGRRAGADRLEKALRAARRRSVAFWRCASERAQAQAVAAEVERLIAREDVAPEDVCVLVRSVRGEGQAVAVAFEERAVPYRLVGRRRVLPARRGARPARLAAAARRPRRRRRRGARARAPAGRAARDRPRARDADRAPAQARHGRPRCAPRSSRRRSRPRRASASGHFLELHRAAAAAIDSTRPDLYVPPPDRAASGCAGSCCSPPRPRSSSAS